MNNQRVYTPPHTQHTHTTLPHPDKVPVKARLLQGFVSAQVQRQPRVREEKVQAAKVEQVVAADLPRKNLDGAGEANRV